MCNLASDWTVSPFDSLMVFMLEVVTSVSFASNMEHHYRSMFVVR